MRLQSSLYGDASDDVRASLQAEPENPSALYLQGLVDYYQNDLPGALAAFDQVLQHNPAEYDCPFFNPLNGYEVNADRGYIFYLQQDFPPAIAAFTRSIEIYPAWAQAYAYRADAYADAGQPELAIADYRSALQLARTRDERDSYQQALDALLAQTPAP